MCESCNENFSLFSKFQDTFWTEIKKLNRDVIGTSCIKYDENTWSSSNWIAAQLKPFSSRVTAYGDFHY